MKTNNNIQIFNNEVFGNVRIIFCQPDEPLFCLKDVCAALALDSKQVIRRLEDGVVSKHPILDGLGRKQMAAFVTEDGLYDVVLALDARDWLTTLRYLREQTTMAQMLTSKLEFIKQLMSDAFNATNYTRSAQRDA